MAAGRSARRLASWASRSATVWGRKISGTPPRVMVSPSFTGAEASTRSPFTSVPPLEPRSYRVHSSLSPRQRAACWREMLG